MAPSDSGDHGYSPYSGNNFGVQHDNSPAATSYPLTDRNPSSATASRDELLPPNSGNYHDNDSQLNLPASTGITAGTATNTQAADAEGLWNMADNYRSGAEPYAFAAHGSGYNAFEKPTKKSNKKKWIIMGVCVLVTGLVVAGVVVAVMLVGKKTSSSTKSTGSTSASKDSPVQQTDPSDPSKFTKDPNLRQAFYGMAYTPEGSQLPDCGNSLQAVIQDIQIMSQLTKRIRLYGADCNQSALVLEAIKQTKVDMKVYLGNYPIATDSGAAYKRQRDIIKDAIQTYGADHIAGVTVGNEFMLNYLNANEATDANSAVGDKGAEILIENIQDTRDMLKSLGIDSMAVGTSDAGSYFNDKVLAAVDYGMANVHPWFANVSAEDSATWTWNFFDQVDIAQANKLSNNPKMYIAETGWPTKSSDAGNANNGPSLASEANLQEFLDTFVCQANNNGTGYFFFELFDEDWKDKQFGGVEGWWGLFSQDRKLKNVKIPDCEAP